MSNYAYSTNGQYEYKIINGQYVLVPIITSNAYIYNNNTNNDTGFFTSSKNNIYLELPEPEITMNHKVPYNLNYNTNYNHFATNQNIYNTNNYNNNNYFKSKENINNLLPNNNLNQNQHNFRYATNPYSNNINHPSIESQRSNTQINRIININSRPVTKQISNVKKIPANHTYFQMNRLKNNIDNNL